MKKIKAIGIRAARTFIQVFAGGFVVGAMPITDLNLEAIVMTAIASTVGSVCMGILAALPEVEDDK